MWFFKWVKVRLVASCTAACQRRRLTKFSASPSNLFYFFFCEFHTNVLWVTVMNTPPSFQSSWVVYCKTNKIACCSRMYEALLGRRGNIMRAAKVSQVHAFACLFSVSVLLPCLASLHSFVVACLSLSWVECGASSSWSASFS